LVLTKDGTAWCVHSATDFIDIQSSQTGFGDTALEAFADFARQGKL
jgi:hypothetical protein